MKKSGNRNKYYLCRKLDDLMKTSHPQILTFLLLVVGGFLFLGGAVGLTSLYIASKDHESTTGVVKKYDRKRVYRHRKIRYESEMLISYPTPKYGEMHVYKKSHCPFREVGDELTVWYHRERPEEIRLPVSESILFGTLVVFGLLCTYGGICYRKATKNE